MNESEKLYKYYNESDAYINRMQAHDEQYFESYFKLIERYITPSGNLLDIGCGSGISTYTIASQFSSVHCTGMDISEKAIAYAQTKFKRDNLHFVAQDVHALTYEENHFDSVVAVDCMEHVPQLETALYGIMKIIKPGGIFIIKGPNHQSSLYTISDVVLFRHRYPFTKSWLDNFQRLRFELAHLLQGLRGNIDFVPREPDLSDTIQVGNDADAVTDMANITVVNFFKCAGWQIKNISWPRRHTVGSMLVSKLLPLWGSMGVVAQKP